MGLNVNHEYHEENEKITRTFNKRNQFKQRSRFFGTMKENEIGI